MFSVEIHKLDPQCYVTIGLCGKSLHTGQLMEWLVSPIIVSTLMGMDKLRVRVRVDSSSRSSVCLHGFQCAL